MGEEIKPSVNHEEDTMSCTFHWRQEYDCPEIISVEVVLGHSAGVNNDIFEIYTEGVFVKDNSPLMVFPLERNNQSDPTKFSTKLNLPKRTYQFIFRIEDAEKGKSFAISKYYQQTTLVSGRIVNYLEAEGTVNSQDQGMYHIRVG